MTKEKTIAERMQELAMNKVSEFEPVKRIMAEIESYAKEGYFDMKFYLAENSAFDDARVIEYLKLNGFRLRYNISPRSFTVLWTHTSTENALYDIANAIEDHS